MPSSRSSSSNNSSRSSNTSKSSGLSKSMSKDNYYCLVLIALIAMLFAIYYFTYKGNREPFTANNNKRKNSGKGSASASSGTPNLKAAQGEKVVALFYADWCPHCVAFKPDFLKAKSTMDGSESKGKTLRLELVDCVENKTIASENNVSGFPTVKIFTDDNKSSEYGGERSYEGLTSYLKK